jgi:hypothetical protein
VIATIAVILDTWFERNRVWRSSLTTFQEKFFCTDGKWRMQTKTNASIDTTSQQDVLSVADYDQVLNDALSALLVNSHIEQRSLDQLQQARQYLFPTMYTRLSSGMGEVNRNTWSGWGWQSIIDSPDLRIGLLEIHRNKSIPIHDHPGACGTLIVLKGKLDVSTYQSSSNNEMDRSGLAVLSKQSKQILEEKEFALITETEGNIHSLASVSDVCVVLDILLRPYDESLRTWYMPASEQVSETDSLVCFCVNNKHFLTRVK